MSQQSASSSSSSSTTPSGTTDVTKVERKAAPSKLVPKILETRLFSLSEGSISAAKHMIDSMEIKQGVYKFKQLLTPFIIYQTTVADSFYYGTAQNQLAPSLSLLDQASTFTALFDQWRIVEMEVMVHPANRTGSTLQYTQTLPPAVYMLEDNDDGASPGTLSACREYQTCEVLDPFRVHTRKVQPRIAAALYNGVSTGYGLAPKGTWVDCSNASVPYYGVKLGISGGNVSQTELWSAWVHVRLTFELRHVR